MKQSKLTDLLPGSAGGRRCVELHGASRMVQLGSAGGRSTVERFGREYMRQLGSAGGRAKRRKEYTIPRTIRAWDGYRYRRIPYWPAGRRRRRPVWVRVELE